MASSSGAAPGSAKVGAKAGPIQLGIAPIGWSNDDLPELGGDISLEQCLREAREAGYAGVEKGGKFPMIPRELKPILEGHGLKLVTGWFSGELRHGTVEREKRRMAGQLQLFLELGAPVLVYAETTGTVQGNIDIPVADRPVMPDEEFKRYGDWLTELAEWLQAEGCPMTFHHHMGTVVETEREVDLLMRHSGEAVGLLLDTGHLTFAGGDVPATTRRHGARINHVHCKDIRHDVLEQHLAERWSFLKGVLEGVFTVPGDGMIDFGPFALLLAEIGYRGWVVVEAEQDPAKANPLEMARIGHTALTKAFSDAGFTII
jgi:inosose dehydratase